MGTDSRDRHHVDGHDGDASVDGYHRLLDAVGGHIAVCALELLRSGRLHAGELERRIPRATRHEVDETLDRLEELGLVERVDEGTANPTYALTAIGRSALHPLRGLRTWAITSYAQAVAYVEAKESLRRHKLI
ncbi:winged helix-turn-helix transcriptional regulator [Bifidobacterium samirii]|uniref:Cinnamoyl ester hydrolase n=1 Tax=Bifidobacterium samirii TaxID=2306974 RepID=A0A430FTT1_9BIFI|nr:winged helix-turn-helix transcriptional regulator [Bifidobacterium samirii]RSX56282.1 cinnamoyl ester hydrolase [Bifidobacterium samirii]